MDVVLTTYGTVNSEFTRKDGLLHNTEFFRVVLDEGMFLTNSKRLHPNTD
jgi:SNF2 family DNA or RNA helicase